MSSKIARAPQGGKPLRRSCCEQDRANLDMFPAIAANAVLMTPGAGSRKPAMSKSERPGALEVVTLYRANGHYGN